jgi:hypothetical protein
MIRSRLKLFPERIRKTITFDNGGEFADHEKLNEINCKTFFCDPYASWQKGGLEHANGRIRRFLPKNTDLSTVSHAEIDKIQRKLNNMPMTRSAAKQNASTLKPQLKFFSTISTTVALQIRPRQSTIIKPPSHAHWHTTEKRDIEPPLSRFHSRFYGIFRTPSPVWWT